MDLAAIKHCEIAGWQKSSYIPRKVWSFSSKRISLKPFHLVYQAQNFRDNKNRYALSVFRDLFYLLHQIMVSICYWGKKWKQGFAYTLSHIRWLKLCFEILGTLTMSTLFLKIYRSSGLHCYMWAIAQVTLTGTSQKENKMMIKSSYTPQTWTVHHTLLCMF